LNLTISFISEDLEIKCVAVSSILPPGGNDMCDGMPELEEYDDIVADLLMVDGLPQNRLLMVDGMPQNRGSLHVHLLWFSAAQC